MTPDLDIDLVRKLASLEAGRRYLEEDDLLDGLTFRKESHVADVTLYAIASRLPGDAFDNYEALGGTFKEAAFDIKMLQGLTGAAGKMVGPVASATRKIAPQAKPAVTSIKKTIRGQDIPEVAEMRHLYNVNQQLGKAR